MQNNIVNIQNFISDKSLKNLIINYTSEELLHFYLETIKNFAKEEGVVIRNYNEESTLDINNSDLFEVDEIKIFNLKSMKKIENEISKQNRSIIFLDYKNYKILKDQYLSVNGYNFHKDIEYLLKTIFKISNNDLINYCIQLPHSVFSEISKYLTNKENYNTNPILSFRSEHILSIRKTIYELKKKKNLLSLYEKIKDEAKFKKFNFLTY